MVTGSPASAAAPSDGRGGNSGVEPWFIATVVVLTSAAIVFGLVMFIVCFCRRRTADLHPTKPTCRGSPGDLTHWPT